MEQAQAKQHSWLSLDMDIDCRHVDVVDGIRGLSVLLVLWFHFWQQTWFMPSYPTPFLSFLGITDLTPSHIRWVGDIFVDMMVLLSAFCLTLPIARSMLLGEGVDDACTFYKKRLARIYPSYLLAVLISFGYQLYLGNYPTISYAVRDLVSHLTFTHMFRADTYIYAPINGVLWTVALEVQFYLFFPLLVKLFRKSPLLFWGTLTGFGALFIYQYALKQTPVNMQVNQFPTFLPVFANGMLAAYLFTLYCVKVPYKRLWAVLFTVLAVLGAVLIRNEIVSAQMYREDKQIWQLENRIGLSLCFTLFLVSAALSLKPLRWLFSNPVARFLGAISYNLYLYHQRLIVLLRMSLGFQSGADVASAGMKMQLFLTVEALGLSILLAAVLTYLWERPWQRWIMSWGRKQETTAEPVEPANVEPEPVLETNDEPAIVEPEPVLESEERK
ncbi:MAG: acyltransferase [Clostridia bacterium]|nr:acyltransferase [Clostridia bacterium]